MAWLGHPILPLEGGQLSLECRQGASWPQLSLRVNPRSCAEQLPLNCHSEAIGRMFGHMHMFGVAQGNVSRQHGSTMELWNAGRGGTRAAIGQCRA